MKEINDQNEENQQEIDFECGNIHEGPTFSKINQIYIFSPITRNPLVMNKGSHKFILKKFPSYISNPNGQDKTKIHPNYSNYFENTYKNDKPISSKPHKTVEKNSEFPSIPQYEFGLPKIENDQNLELKNQIQKEVGKDRISLQIFTPDMKTNARKILNKEMNIKLFESKYFDFNEHCSEFTKNYIQYSLTIKSIYRQYLIISKGNKEITRSQSFKDQTEKTEHNREILKKDLKYYGSNFD